MVYIMSPNKIINHCLDYSNMLYKFNFNLLNRLEDTRTLTEYTQELYI